MQCFPRKRSLDMMCRGRFLVSLLVALSVADSWKSKFPPCRISWQMEPDCAMIKAIPHKDCATDASSNFSSDETKSGVNTWCIHEHFCEIWESVSYLTYADCVVRFFERWREKRRKSFVDFRVFSRNISENMHARCMREDTKQALKRNLQADGVQSRQTLFVRCCLKNFVISAMLHKKTFLLSHHYSHLYYSPFYSKACNIIDLKNQKK